MIWIIITLIALTLIILFIKTSKKARSTHQHPYNKTTSLFTPAERSFLGVLNQAIEDNAFVFGKVRVADVLKPSKDVARKQWRSAFLPGKFCAEDGQ